MKKIFALFLILVVLLTLFGCANKETITDTSTETSSASANETAASYDPAVVDDITSDLDNMTW